jgi:formate hydrogenlyase transcriptional activator
LVDARLAAVCARSGRTPPQIARRVRARLVQYAWPRNVRELENEIERALLLSDGDALEWESPSPAHRPIAFDESVVRTIEDALRACGGRIYGARGAAARLGLRPSTLQTKMQKHGIVRARFVRSRD